MSTQTVEKNDMFLISRNIVSSLLIKLVTEDNE